MIEQPIIRPLPGLKKIPRRIFYKKTGEAIELLADEYHLYRYLSRGFTLEPPGLKEVTEEITEGNYVCEACGFVASDATALGCHRRKHNGRLKKKS